MYVRVPTTLLVGIEFFTTSSRVLNNCRICMWYPKKLAYFSSKQIDLSSIHVNLAQNRKLLTDNSRKCRVLICSINAHLVAGVLRRDESKVKSFELTLFHQGILATLAWT